MSLMTLNPSRSTKRSVDLGLSSYDDALDTVRQVEPASQSGEHVGVHLSDEPLGPIPRPFRASGKHLRDQDPDGEGQDELDADWAVHGLSISAHAGPTTKVKSDPTPRVSASIR